MIYMTLRTDSRHVYEALMEHLEYIMRECLIDGFDLVYRGQHIPIGRGA